MARIERALGELPNTGYIFSDITVEREGAAVRDMIAESVIPSLDSNEGMTRISAEVLHHCERITWHSDEAKPPPVQLRSLDNLGSSKNKPSAHFDGLALSSAIVANPVNEIYGERHAADEFDQGLSRMKRRRTKDVSPYVALSKRDGYFYILREYMPEQLARKLSECILKEVLREILTRQEYRYALLDRILTNKTDTLPQLSLFTEMERATIALEAGKLKVRLHFGVGEIFIAYQGMAL